MNINNKFKSINIFIKININNIDKIIDKTNKLKKNINEIIIII